MLQFAQGRARKVASSFEALECLEQEWPEWARGRNWRAADRVCRDALEGWRGPRDARKAFIKAAARAGIMVRGGRPAKFAERSLPLVRPQGGPQQPSLSSAG
jgi:hypothetical protein